MQYNCLAIEIDIDPLKAALEKTNLWDKYPLRRLQNSPHREMKDIWVRYNNIQPFLKSGDFSTVNDEHDSIWYETELKKLVKPIANEIMHHVQGERLGGILITKLPPNKQIYPHKDSGWHATYYDKYYVCVKDQGSRFLFVDGTIEPKEGQVWWFDNSKMHSVKNTDQERIAMIICIKTDRRSSCLLE